ncbi:MAG: zinc ribbon domain-containing protein [Bacteroidales bacterium]|jgi:predicted amidophosphoribosyltransferase|nr:zinc ribbon domain-containing protein [Bacteroidales bacterium]
MKKQNKVCQSCGMPLSKDPQGCGTNADGSANHDYCSYCYKDGKFLFDGSVLEFQEFCRKMMVESGHSKVMAWLFTRGMKRLARWKKS